MIRHRRGIHRNAGALNALYQSNPEVFREFLQELAETVGIPSAGHALASFECPNCGYGFSIAGATQRKVGTRGRRGRRPGLRGSVNPLLVRLAKVKGVMVGDVHKEFTKSLGVRRKGLTKDEIRARKLDWIKSELNRLSVDRRKSSAA